MRDLFPVLHALQVSVPMAVRATLDQRYGRSVLPQGDPTRLRRHVCATGMPVCTVLPGPRPEQ